MKNNICKTMTNTVMMFVFVSVSYAHEHGNSVYWRIDPSVKSCSMVIDPSLTQSQWKTFVQQVGAISTFKSLASAEPLGTLNFNIGIDNSNTPVDQHNLAWINTFTHPDAECPLGDVIVIPTVRASMGISENMDIGAYWTSAPDANYGMAGGEFKYRFSKETEDLPAVAVRGSVSALTGVPDYNLSSYSVELIASKRVAMFTPYVGFRESMTIGTETTSKVNLNSESLLIAQGYAGVVYSLWSINLAAEYNVSYVNTFTFVIGFNL